MAATDLHDLAVEVLAAAGQILDTTTTGSPARAFVSHGPPALDCCDQLAVHVANIGEATTGTNDPLGPGLRRSRVNLTGLIVTGTRCHPTIGDGGLIPSADELTAAAATLNADAWALWNGLYRMRGDLFANCDLVFFDACVPLPPQGGCAGYVMQIRFELGGYASPVGS